MTKQTTIVVIGSLRVKVFSYFTLFYFYVLLPTVLTPSRRIVCLFQLLVTPHISKKISYVVILKFSVKLKYYTV